jgi:thiol-disulfide isomerase/thioredoxin
MTRQAIFLLTGVMLLAAGCARKPSPPASEAALRTLDGPGLAATIAKHHGQVVLLDFWATWCGPCLELFPHTMELQRQFGDRGLSVITVSLDDPDNAAAVRKFLAQNTATAENFLSPYGVGPAAFKAFGIDDGALPHVHIYDRQGKLARTFQSGGKTIDAKKIKRTLEKLL